MSKAVHAIKYFSSQNLLLCRKNQIAYKEYKTLWKMISPKFDEDYEALKALVTCKNCLKILALDKGGNHGS